MNPAVNTHAVFHAWCDHLDCATWQFSAPPVDFEQLRTQVEAHADTGHAPVIASTCTRCGDHTPQRHVLSVVIDDARAHGCGDPHLPKPLASEHA